MSTILKILKITTLDGYHDKDEIMLHACFQLLVDYFEIEVLDFEITPEYDELKSLYEWWQNRKLRILPEVEIPDDYMISINGRIIWNESKYPEVAEIERQQNQLIEQWELEDQSKLERLVQLRGLLWS